MFTTVVVDRLVATGWIPTRPLRERTKRA